MIKPEQEKEFYRLVGMVAKMAVRVSQETELCVFFEISGHIDGFSLRIARSKTAYHDYLYDKKNFAQLEQTDIEVLREFFKTLCGYLNGPVDAKTMLEAA